MTAQERTRLLAEKQFLTARIDSIPAAAGLTRASLQSRLKTIEGGLQVSLNRAHRDPARARLTFGGRPVVRSHGVFADFGTKAAGRFVDAIAAVAASITAPLAAMGPIPGRDQNQLLIIGTAIGSFGFELEEHQADAAVFPEPTSAGIALERTQKLLAGSIDADDEVLADAAAELDPRALDKVRDFVSLLADNEAFCGLSVGDHVFQFSDSGQVRRSLARLGSDNLKKREVVLAGEFLGVLPTRRTFEFLSGGQVLVGKIGPGVERPEIINAHLKEPVQLSLMETQVGSGRPRYVIIKQPADWDSPDSVLANRPVPPFRHG